LALPAPESSILNKIKGAAILVYGPQHRFSSTDREAIAAKKFKISDTLRDRLVAIREEL